MDRSELSALALEYQGDYGTASRDLNVLDLINDPTANGVFRVFGLGASEELGDLVGIEIRTVLDNRPNPLLIGKDTL